MSSGQGLAPPPPGVEPNLDYNSPDGRTLAVVITCIFFSSIFVWGRLSTRFWALGSIGWDDGWLIFAYSSAMATFAMFLKASALGYGHHLWDIQATRSTDLAMWTSIAGLFYLVPILCLKLSFFLTFLRIFRPHRSMRWLCWFGVFACSVCYVVFFLLRIFSCNPARKTFIVDLPGTCGALAPQAIASGIVNSITDLYITIIPLPYLWRLQMSWRKKLRIGMAFSMGYFCTAVSLARLVLTVLDFNSLDPYYDYWNIALWVYLELTVGLMAASCLVMPAFVEKIASPVISKVASYASSVRSRTASNETAVSSSQHSLSRHSKEDQDTSGLSDDEKAMKINKTTTYTVERQDKSMV